MQRFSKTLRSPACYRLDIYPRHVYRCHMTKTIHQFMWGFQPHFRWSVQYDIQQVFSQIGLESFSQTKVFL